MGNSSGPLCLYGFQESVSSKKQIKSKKNQKKQGNKNFVLLI